MREQRAREKGLGAFKRKECLFRDLGPSIAEPIEVNGQESQFLEVEVFKLHNPHSQVSSQDSSLSHMTNPPQLSSRHPLLISQTASLAVFPPTTSCPSPNRDITGPLGISLPNVDSSLLPDLQTLTLPRPQLVYKEFLYKLGKGASL